MPIRKKRTAKKLPKKTALGRSRDYKKNSQEKHEVAYRKRKKKSTTKKKK